MEAVDVWSVCAVCGSGLRWELPRRGADGRLTGPQVHCSNPMCEMSPGLWPTRDAGTSHIAVASPESLTPSSKQLKKKR